MSEKSYAILSILLTFTVLLSLACNNQVANEESEAKQASAKQDSVNEQLLSQSQNLFEPLPPPADISTPLAQLGKKLFHETSLSISRQMSCNTCHQVSEFGVDNEKTSLGHDKSVRGERNSPTVYNAFVHSSQFWDGRAADLVEQAKGPVLNPVEMGMPDEATVLKNLNGKEVYQQMFAEAFPSQKKPVNFHNMALAIAEFEKTLTTPGKFDEYLSGNISTLSEDERAGLQTFIKVGCTTCHTGPALGGQLFQKFGLFEGPYWEFTGSEHIDSGRVKVTGKSSDAFVFKVPGLRNVAKTAPYFHDGSVADLEEAIKIMGKTQLGRELSEEEISQIKTFLESLTGEIPDYALPQPEGERVAQR